MLWIVRWNASAYKDNFLNLRTSIRSQRIQFNSIQFIYIAPNSQHMSSQGTLQFNQIIQSNWYKVFYLRKTSWLHWLIDSNTIPHTKHACSDSGEEKLPFNRKKPPAEPGSVWAAICQGRLGFKETEAEIQKAAVKGGPVQETHSQADELQGSSHARGWREHIHPATARETGPHWKTGRSPTSTNKGVDGSSTADVSFLDDVTAKQEQTRQSYSEEKQREQKVRDWTNRFCRIGEQRENEAEWWNGGPYVLQKSKPIAA